MNIKHFCIALGLGITLFNMTSCNLSAETKQRIVRKAAGKDDFRDSEKWGKVVTKTLNLADFTHISLLGNADIKFTQGETLKVEACGNEKAIAENDISVKDGLLTIKHKESAPDQVPTIKLLITAPNLESIFVAGTGDIDLKDKAEFPGILDIIISGTGDVDIEQVKCRELTISISGAGDINAQKIKSRKASIAISGAGDLTADLKANDINVKINGAGNADLDVKCRNLNVTANGTGEVELKGECAHLTKQSGGLSSIDSRKLTIHEGVVIQ